MNDLLSQHKPTQALPIRAVWTGTQDDLRGFNGARVEREKIEGSLASLSRVPYYAGGMNLLVGGKGGREANKLPELPMCAPWHPTSCLASPCRPLVGIGHPWPGCRATLSYTVNPKP